MEMENTHEAFGKHIEIEGTSENQSEAIVKQSKIREKQLAKHREVDENYTDSVGTPKTSWKNIGKRWREQIFFKYWL